MAGIGVTADTRASSRVPFNIDQYFLEYQDKKRSSPHPEAKLVSVEVVPNVVKDKYKLLPEVKLAPGAKPTVEQVTPESLRYGLAFQFEDLQGIQEYQYRMFEVEVDDPKKDNKERMNNERLAHFWEAYRGANTAATDLSTKAVVAKGVEVTWKSYFEGVAAAFNTKGEENTPIYKDVPVRIKLTRNTGAQNPNSLAMPLGNVIERIVKEAKTSTLVIGSADEYLTRQKAQPAKGFGAPAGGGFGPVKTTDDGWGNNDDV
jgi:hypothetical protein